MCFNLCHQCIKIGTGLLRVSARSIGFVNSYFTSRSRSLIKSIIVDVLYYLPIVLARIIILCLSLSLNKSFSGSNVVVIPCVTTIPALATKIVSSIMSYAPISFRMVNSITASVIDHKPTIVRMKYQAIRVGFHKSSNSF